jgi:uncharacterized metal-binding protein
MTLHEAGIETDIYWILEQIGISCHVEEDCQAKLALEDCQRCIVLETVFNLTAKRNR